MGVRILNDTNDSLAALYCSTTDRAFGPVFYDEADHDASERAEAFLRWLPQDARRYSEADLFTAFGEWRAQEAKQRADDEAKES